MATGIIVAIIVIVCILLILAGMGIRVVQQWERGVVLRVGKIVHGVYEPGLTLIVPVIDRMNKVNMQVVTMGVPSQDCITRDNVSVRVDAVVYFRVIDPVKAIVNVQNYMYAVSQEAQTTLRSVIGKADLDQILSEREVVNAEIREIVDEHTENAWGIKIERVEVKDVSLPESMKRAMSHQAEAERDRRARIIAADGEYQASKRLSEAAQVMSQNPSSLQLRLLQTVVDVAAERNSTLVMPMPIELLRFFERFGGKAPTDGEQAAERPATGEAATGEAVPEPAEEAGEHPEDAPVPEIEAPPSVPETIPGLDATQKETPKERVSRGRGERKPTRTRGTR